MAAVLLVVAAQALAQTIVVPTQVVIRGAPAGFPAGLPPGIQLAEGQEVPAGVPSAPASPEDARLQEILQLQFDRRPSAILQSMADRGAADTNDLPRFKKAVDSGNWPAVGEFLKTLPTNQVDRVYLHLLRGLQRVPQENSGQPDAEAMAMMMMRGAPRPEAFLLPDEVLVLSELKPAPLNDGDVQALGQLLQRAASKGTSMDSVLKRLAEGTPRFGGSDTTNRLRTATLLFAAGRPVEAGAYLPPIESLTGTNDLPQLAMHAQSLAAQGSLESRKEAVEQAWDLNLRILRTPDASPEVRTAALNRTFELLPRVKADLGTNWLRDTFTHRPDEGLTLLSAVAGMVAADAANHDIERRRANFELQRRIVEELLAVTPDARAAWGSALNLLASGWMREGDYSRARHRPRRNNRFPQFDQFGNQVFLGDEMEPMMYQDPNQLPPVPVDQLLPTAPDERWLGAVDPSLMPRLRALIADLQIKAEEDAKALPHIEALAPLDAKAATRLANDYLRVWARTHDPNPQPQYNYPRYYYPGMMQPTGIPLTRSLQGRNLRELSANLDRLRKLSLQLDDTAVIAAFSAAHSPAEVFREEDIERVFGPAGRLKASTLSGLLQTMRERLAGQWRAARVQQEAKTKRTDKEVEAEVTRGYELLTELEDRALQERPDDWRLQLVRGATLFDWAEFDYGKKVDLKIYTEKRDQAFRGFEKAAALYAAQVLSLEDSEQTPQVFQQWFNVTLGASDLSYLTRQQEADTNHLARVRTALHGLPAAVAERHIAAFGSGLAGSMESIKPELKPRYLRAGLQVVGDHPSVAEVRKVVEHYEDLLQEVALDVHLDGPAEVGHTDPFGVFIGIRYTEALGREGGNFTKYLQNQQGQNYYYNPYGTPPMNYREDFEKQVKSTWDPGFEILAVTFHDEKVEPRGFGRPGWRETPYAYVLLKARDASVDRLPPLRLDLDFVDRRGPVILPVQSQVLLVDARADHVPTRPLDGVECVQILDDREAAQGRLGLEIKATGRGILPPLDGLVDLSLPGFRIEKKPDAPLTLTQLDASGDAVAPVTERSLVLNLIPEPGRGQPAAFRFATPRLEGMTNIFKRYADADIVEVKPEVALEGLRLRPSPVWPWLAGLAVAATAIVLWLRTRPAATATAAQARRYELPSQISPFSVLQLLQRLAADRTLNLGPERRAELNAVIRELETRYFSPTALSSATGNGNGHADLESIARRWVGDTA